MGTRNAPGLFNLAWQKDFMWDGGVHHIELSPLNALTTVCEMDDNLEFTITKLQQSPTYPLLFRSAFGSSFINSQRMLRALAQFTSMMISSNSRYDQWMRHENKVEFTAEEKTGYLLFKSNCASCHTEPLFSDGTFRSNGLDIVSEDRGREIITHKATDKGKFKVPSLRNVALSSPYMHDGRFNTLKQVLEHYNSGVKKAPNLDLKFKRKDGGLGIKLNVIQQNQLISFLNTLTDTIFVKDTRFH